MGVALKLFDNYYINSNFLPSSIEYEKFDIDFIDGNFIYSRGYLENILEELYKLMVIQDNEQ